jgi:hypothetical protein
MVDDQVHAIDGAAEVVRLHVHHGNPIEVVQLPGGDDLDVDVEQIHHPDVLRPCHPLEGGDDRRLLGPAQDVAEREAAGDRVGVGIVVQQDQDAVGVAEEALVLLDAEAGERAAELGEEGTAEEL